MKEAIQKAIEGGYEETEQLVDERDFWVFLDINFWKCLGKAEGWKNLQWKKMYGDFGPAYQTGRWHYEMHRFIDWIAEGKEVDDFFEELLGAKEITK